MLVGFSNHKPSIWGYPHLWKLPYWPKTNLKDEAIFELAPLTKITKQVWFVWRLRRGLERRARIRCASDGASGWFRRRKLDIFGYIWVWRWPMTWLIYIYMVNIIHQINPLLSLKNSAEHRKVLVDDFLTSRHHGLPIIHSFIHSFISLGPERIGRLGLPWASFLRWSIAESTFASKNQLFGLF